MWILIIIALVVIFIIIGARNSMKSFINNKVTTRGGMLIIFKTLIDGLLQDDNARIFKVTDNSISLGVTNIDGTTMFRINQLYDKVSVDWKLSSITYGNHILRWEFPDQLDQNKMLETITSHVIKHSDKLIADKIQAFQDKSNEDSMIDDLDESLKSIVEKFNCQEAEEKEIYFIKMDELNPTENNLAELLYHLSKKTIEEAKNGEISPKYTQSGIFYKWAVEYSEKNKIRVNALDLNVFSDLYESDPSFLLEFIDAIGNKDDEKIKTLVFEDHSRSYSLTPKLVNLYDKMVVRKQ